jgi:hypothetical protein
MDTAFLWFELLSLMVAVFSYQYLKGSNLFWFIPFLILTNIQEWGSHYGLFTYNDNNSLSVNIFTTIEFMFYSWLFYQEITKNSYRKIIFTTSLILLVAIIINILFVQGPHTIHTYTFLGGSVLMVFFVFLYFYDLFFKEQAVVLRNNPIFWICIGLLFYYTGMFSIYAFLHVVSDEMKVRYAGLFFILVNVFNIILYSCFTIAFLCRRWKSIS